MESAGPWIVLLVTMALFRSGTTIDSSSCVVPLGMESVAIADEDLSASTSFDGASVGPQNARVRLDRAGGAWCPRQQATHQPRDWLEINLKTDHVITAVESQGRFGNGQGQEFAEHYMLEYWREPVAKWVRYKNSKGEEVIEGNTNTYTAVKRDLDPVIITRKLRFLPYSHHRRTVCMRVEIYGCQWTEGIVSYSMPQGDQRGTGWQFYDASYDGIWDGALLTQGLGQLTDGKFGPDNFKASYYDQDRGWVGWRNDSRDNKPVEIVFEFDGVRDFTQLTMFYNNQFTKDVQLPGEIDIHFSIGGKTYLGEPIVFKPVEDRIFEQSRNVTIKLHHRVGRFVKVRLHFAHRWILVSEFTFRSEPTTRNYTAELDVNAAATPVPAATVVPASAVPEANAPPANAREGWSQSNAEAADRTVTTNGDGNSGQQSESRAYLAVVIGVLVAVSVLLAAVIFFMVMRHRQRKSVGSPLPDKTGWANVGAVSASPRLGDALHREHLGELNGVGGGVGGGSGGAGSRNLYSKNGTLLPYCDPRCAGDAATQFLLPPPQQSQCLQHVIKTEYQEPYHALQFSPYYSYSTLLLAGSNAISDGHIKTQSQGPSAASDNYDYAVPDVSSVPLLERRDVHQPKLPSVSPPSAGILMAPEIIDTMTSATSNGSSKSGGSGASSTTRSNNNKNTSHYIDSPLKKPVDRADLLAALKSRADILAIPELPRNRLRLVQRIASGAFGTVYTAEADNIPEYNNASVATARRLVAAKYLPNASDKDRSGFYQEVRLLAALDDPHLSRVLAVCTTDEPFCVILEYLEHGDLSQFLRGHRLQLDSSAAGSRGNVSKIGAPPDDTLTMGSLIFIAGQIASGMRYLESLNFVHRDLAARNCLVGKGLQIKISDFGTDSDTYASDYYRPDGQLLGLPVRWMAWESVIQAKYTTKSDVWAFAVTLWEILVLSRQRPYAEMDDEAVVENLKRFSQGSVLPCISLSKPQHCPRDIYDLMCECWRRLPTERPSFREIHLFLQRKNLGYSPT